MTFPPRPQRRPRGRCWPKISKQSVFFLFLSVTGPARFSTLSTCTIKVNSMRFGLFVPQGWRLDLAGISPAEQWKTMLDIARTAETGLFESVWVYDHFHTVPVPTQEATHEAWSLMAAFGAATSRVRLRRIWPCIAYRDPAHLAPVPATVHPISGGPAQLGIGAGWDRHAWRGPPSRVPAPR